MTEASTSTAADQRGPAVARPQPGPAREYHFPRFERRVLPNGLELIVAPVPKLPVVTMLAVIDAGALNDPAGKEGVALLTARALTEGTTSSDGTQLTERFERLGTAFDASASWDSAIAKMTVMSNRVEAAFPIFGEVLRSPAFPERDVERLRAERLAELLQVQAEPRGLADLMFDRLLYDATSRYAVADGGTTKSVAGLTRDDVLRYYESRVRPGATKLILVGDITMDAAERLATRVFGDWSGETPQRATVVDRPARRQRAVHLVAKPDAAQSELRIGHVGVPRLHPDYFGITVMNAVLGGLFSSRINLNLRERHGYTYGAFSEFDWRTAAGPFVVSTAVQSDVTVKAAREALSEIDRMQVEEISQDELTLATHYLDGVFPIRYETTAAIAGAIANLVIFGLPENYFDVYREKVRGVTTATVLDAARRHLHPDQLQLLVVGDPEVVRVPLEELDFGAMSVYDTEGKILEAAL
jgi:zinc protease